MQSVCDSKTRSFSVVFTFFIVLVIGIVANPRNPSAVVSETAAYAIGFETYLYLYPFVIMDITRLQAINVGAESFAERAPMNAFAHAETFPPGDFREVIRPNFDTLYSTAWLDRRQYWRNRAGRTATGEKRACADQGGPETDMTSDPHFGGVQT